MRHRSIVGGQRSCIGVLRLQPAAVRKRTPDCAQDDNLRAGILAGALDIFHVAHRDNDVFCSSTELSGGLISRSEPSASGRFSPSTSKL